MKRPAHPGLAESLLGLLLVLALVAFASSVIPLAFNNTRSADWDQASYLMVGLRIARGTALTDGNRNPLYPLLLAPIAERDIGYFTHAKWLSLGLGIAGLVVVYFVSRYYVGPVGALLVTLMLAHNIQYQQAASHVDVEVLLTPLFYLAWHSSCRVLAALDSGEKGLTSSAVLAGVWSGLSYLAKGTGLLLIPLFIATLVVLAGSRYLKRREILIFMLTFIVVASPLWLYNWVTYGSPYYNVNTTHYMWNDSWEDNYVHASEELPTALTYLQTHTVTDMWERLIKGLETVPQQWYGALHIYGMPQGITGTAWVVAVLAAVSLAAAGVTSWKTSRTWFLLTLTGILGFALLFAWYHPIDDAPRFVLPWVPVVYLVPLWSLRTLIPPKVRTWLSRGAGALAALVIIITLWHRPLPLNLLRNMSSHDRRAEAEGIAFMAELLKQTDAGESVAIGPTHDLPYWLAFDRRLMHIPYTRPNWPSFQTWLFRNDIRTVVINEEVWNRRRILLSKALAKTDQGLIGQQLPPGWKLNEPAAFPCSTCMFTVDNSFLVPEEPLQVDYEDSFRLRGYTVTPERIRVDQSFEFLLFWELLSPLEETIHVFVHGLDHDGNLVAQDDHQLLVDLNFYPDADFPSGTLVRGMHEFSALPAGRYDIHVGLYRWEDQQRLMTWSTGGTDPEHYLKLTELDVK